MVCLIFASSDITKTPLLDNPQLRLVLQISTHLNLLTTPELPMSNGLPIDPLPVDPLPQLKRGEYLLTGQMRVFAVHFLIFKASHYSKRLSLGLP